MSQRERQSFDHDKDKRHALAIAALVDPSLMRWELAMTEAQATATYSVASVPCFILCLN